MPEEMVLLLLLALLAGAASPAVVLPRPPSSPNHIPQVYAPSGRSRVDYTDKVTYQQSTNVEKPDTQDYRFVEIELRDGDNVETLDLHGLVQAVLDQQPVGQSPLLSPSQQRRFDFDPTPDEEGEQPRNQSYARYPQPEVVPRSILGVRDVGLGQRVFEPLDSSSLADLEARRKQHYLLDPETAVQPSDKDLGNEKLYYLKSSRPKVYVNFRGRTGNFRQDGLDSRAAAAAAAVRLEPAVFLRATQPYRDESKPKTLKRPPKKYDSVIHGGSANSRKSSGTTTENTMVTSSELPKQIPAPPSRIPSRSPVVHTTPVQRFTAAAGGSARRTTDVTTGYYAFAET